MVVGLVTCGLMSKFMLEVGKSCEVALTELVDAHGFENCGGGGYGIWSKFMDPMCRCWLSRAMVMMKNGR